MQIPSNARQPTLKYLKITFSYPLITTELPANSFHVKLTQLPKNGSQKRATLTHITA
jgi:hypothetical protein